MEQNKIALITGASKGIGAAIAKQLASDGYDIWLNYFSDDKSAQEVCNKIKSCGRKCQLLKFDVRDYEGVKKYLNGIINNNTPYVLVNNAGIAAGRDFINLDFKEWQDVINVKLNGFFNMVKTVLPKMIEAKKGKIINISSISAHAIQKGTAHYAAANAGLSAAARSLALEVAEHNILVNTISPGIVNTDGSRLNMASHVPLKRLAEVDDIANLVSFLVSDKADYITGHEFHINGGLFMKS